MLIARTPPTAKPIDSHSAVKPIMEKERRAVDLNGLLPARIRDEAARSFWALPAAGMLIGALGAFAINTVEIELGLSSGIVSAAEAEAVRGLLETIATVTVSVAGIAFSVTVVALQLASQQLSPRILRSFQDDRLSQATLAIFLGLFVYALVLLARMGGSEDPGTLGPAVAVIMAVCAFAMFAAFIHNVVISLQASTLIRRTAADARGLMKHPYPYRVGDVPEDLQAAEDDLARRARAGVCRQARSPRAGYVTAVDGVGVLAACRRHDGVARQVMPIGDFTLTGSVLAEVWADDGETAEELAEAVSGAFAIATERSLVQDVAYPIRQLADVALKGVSTGLNDPTTAENAMDSLADALVVFAGHESAPALRADEAGVARFQALAPDLDDLTRLGFDQVRGRAIGYPTLSLRMLRLLDEIRRAAAFHGAGHAEVDRQRELIMAGIDEGAPTPADAERVRAHPSGGAERDS